MVKEELTAIAVDFDGAPGVRFDETVEIELEMFGT